MILVIVMVTNNFNKIIYTFIIMSRLFIRNNITSVSIIIFIFLFIGVQKLEPSFLYNLDGSLKQFGLGRKKHTVAPVWLVSLILAIFSYLFVLYYLAIPKFKW